MPQPFPDGVFPSPGVCPIRGPQTRITSGFTLTASLTPARCLNRFHFPIALASTLIGERTMAKREALFATNVTMASWVVMSQLPDESFFEDKNDTWHYRFDFIRRPVMAKTFLPVIFLLSIAAVALSAEPSADAMKSYPIKIVASQAKEFAKLDINFANLRLQGETITAIPIAIEPGITGLVLLGNGTYAYSPESGKDFDGHFRAAMLRFNPKDADSILKLDGGKSITDKSAGELAHAILLAAMRHCYHSSGDALVPPEHAIAATLYSKELGDVLISIDGTTSIVYSFTDGQELFERK
jgi:hypothetical protein